jgi:hypothetical protein
MKSLKKLSPMAESTKIDSMPSWPDLTEASKALDAGWEEFKKANPAASRNDYLDSPDLIKNMRAYREP